MIIGLDDTDMPGTPGTNQLARRIAEALPDGLGFDVVLRHQLLFDDRIPYTSKNGSASIGVVGEASTSVEELLAFLRERVRAFAPKGSDPGLCVAYAPGESGDAASAAVESATAAVVPSAPPAAAWDDVIAFGHRCQQYPVRREDALAVAQSHGIVLEPLGGTGDDSAVHRQVADGLTGLELTDRAGRARSLPEEAAPQLPGWEGGAVRGAGRRGRRGCVVAPAGAGTGLEGTQAAVGGRYASINRPGRPGSGGRSPRPPSLRPA